MIIEIFKNNMKNIYIISCLLINYILYGQVGMGTVTPRGALDINNPTSYNMGLVLPTNASVSNIINPQGGAIVPGTIMYDNTLHCIRYFKSTTSAWSNCLDISSIVSLDCSGVQNNGLLTAGQSASSVNSVYNYTGGNGSAYITQNVNSNGITGLTATLAAGNYAVGNGTLTYNITGTPSGAGTASFAINIGGQMCTLQRTVSPVSVVSTFNCAGVSNNGTISSNVPVGGSVTSIINYTGGNGGNYAAEVVNSTGVTGLTATRNAGTLGSSGSVTYTISGTANGVGLANFAISLGGISCNISRTVNASKTAIVVVKTNGNQVVAPNQDMTFDSVPYSNSISSNGTDITLLAGKTYRLKADMRVLNSNISHDNCISFEFINAASPGTRLAGTTRGRGTPSRSGTNEMSFPANGIYTVGAANENIRVRMKDVETSSIYGDVNGWSTVEIEELTTGSSYAVGSFNSDQNFISTLDIPWTQVTSGGGASISGANITLVANKTYRLTSNIRASLSNPNYFNFKFVNSSNTLLTGTAIGFAMPHSNTTYGQSSVPASGIYKVGAANENIKLQVVSSSGIGNINGTGTGGNSSIVAEEVPDNFIYAVGAITDGTTGNQVISSGVATDVIWQTQLASNGGATISGSSITLPPNHTYRLTADLRAAPHLPTGQPNYLVVSFVNNSNGQLAGTTTALISPGQSTVAQNQSQAMGIYKTGATSEVIKVRIIGSSGNHTLTGDGNGYSQVTVTQLD